MQKIILFYRFMPVKDPAAVRLWQRALCQKLNLKGRVLIADHGINGTLGGDINDLKDYVKETKSYFKDTVFKWSAGKRDYFPKLVVKVRPEIVTFGVPEEIKVTERGIEGGGQHLKPAEVHQLLQARGHEVVFFDGRNAWEAEIGHFKGAIVPGVRHTRDFVKELESSKYDTIKGRPIVTYCTGGIRCEVLSVLMKNRGFTEVYQIDGGIVKYGEAYGDDGLWEGSLYVFDDRIATTFSDKAKDIGTCAYCAAKTSRYINCENKSCNRRVLVCAACQQYGYCPACRQVQVASTAARR